MNYKIKCNTLKWRVQDSDDGPGQGTQLSRIHPTIARHAALFPRLLLVVLRGSNENINSLLHKVFSKKVLRLI